MVALGLLLTADYYINGPRIEFRGSLLRSPQLFLTLPELLLRKQRPVDHIAALVYAPERLERHPLVLFGINSMEREGKGRTLDRLDMSEQRSLVAHYYRHVLKRKLGSCGDVSSPALVSEKPVLALLPEPGAEHHGAVEERVVGRAVGKAERRKVHGQPDGQLVGRLPPALYAQIAVGGIFRVHRLSVEGKFHLGCFCPSRSPYAEPETLRRLAAGEAQRGEVSIGEGGLLLHTDIAPFEGRGNKEVDYQFVFAPMGINHLAVAGVVLHSGAHTAPETCLRLRIYTVMAGTHGREVHETSLYRIYGGKDMVVHGTLVKIDIGSLGAALVEEFRQTQHIVGVAGLGTLFAGEHARKVVGRVEMLPDAVASDAHGPVVHDCRPEETRRLVPVAVPLEVGDALDSYHLGNLGIGMHAGKAVLAAQQRLEHILMREAVRKFKI